MFCPRSLTLLLLSACVDTSDDGGRSDYGDDTVPLDSEGVETAETDDTSPTDTNETGDDTGPPAFELPEGIEVVVFVTMDTFRFDMMDDQTTPWLYARTREGVRLANMWDLGNWTRGTMPGLITGRTGPNVGPEIYLQDGPHIPSDVTTLARAMNDAGWSTYADNANNVWGSTINGLDGYEEIVECMGIYPSSGFSSATEQFNRTISWLQGTSGRRFAHVHTMETHDPYMFLADSCRDDVERLDAECPFAVTTTGTNGLDWGQYSPSEQEACSIAIQAAHRCTATYLDNEIEAFLVSLDEAGLLEHTLVVFTQDHGEFWGEHGVLNHHRLMYAPVSRAFGWVWWRGAPTLVVSQATSQADITPTILAFTGADIPAEMDGVSVHEIPEGRAVTQFACDAEQSYHGAVSADGKRHLILNINDRGEDVWELYAPNEDLLEESVLSEAYPNELVGAIEAQRSQTATGYCE